MKHSKNYEGLMQRSPKQSPLNVFAHFPYDNKSEERKDQPYARLASLAKEENWNFNNQEFISKYRSKYPILINYLNYTFLRVQELGYIVYSQDGDKACFNTGLQTKNDKDIYALFFRNKQADMHNAPDWTLYTFVDSYSQKLAPYTELPPIATYIEDASDLVFDTKLEIEINMEHIVDKNKERMPELLQENTTLARHALEGAIKSLKSKVIRNYKIAIPHWYDGKMQLLLPLNLIDENVADLALVVDKDKDRNIYRATTILTMDWAYIDARLITRPDRDWLNP